MSSPFYRMPPVPAKRALPGQVLTGSLSTLLVALDGCKALRGNEKPDEPGLNKSEGRINLP
jgi:hypothetical protein